MPTNAATTTVTFFDNTEKNTSFLEKLDRVRQLNHGIIVEVLSPEQATLAEYAGARAVLVKDRLKNPNMPSDSLIQRIKDAVKIPVMVQFRIGHSGEAKELDSGKLVQFIEESISSKDGLTYIGKHAINVPVVGSGQKFEEGLNRVYEGAYDGARAGLIKDQLKNPGSPNDFFIKRIKDAVKTPVMAQFLSGHSGQAKDLASRKQVRFIEESKVGPAYIDKHAIFVEESKVGPTYIDKHAIKVPVVGWGQNFEEGLNRVNEGATFFRLQGGAVFQGNSSERFMDTVKLVRAVFRQLKRVECLPDDNKVLEFAKFFSVPYNLVLKVKELRKFPVPIFAAGGIVTPADVMLMMNLGCDGVFVDNQVFDRDNKFQVLKQMAHVAANVADLDGLINLMLGENGNGGKNHSGYSFYC